jgi:hypothetical protein
MILKTLRQALPREDIRRQRTFAWAVVGLLLCGSPLLSAWITVVASDTKATSKLRQFHRWLGNPRVNVAAYYQPFIQRALSGWSGVRIVLAIDGTSVRDDCVLCRVALIYRGRAIPLVWLAIDSRSHSIAFDRYVELLKQTADLLPPDCDVTLLGDRGFGHRKLMTWCTETGWDFVLRLKSDSWMVLPDGRRKQLRSLRPPRQSLLHVEGAQLLESGNRLTAPLDICIIRAPEPAEEFWYLATSRPGGYDVVADYRLRAGIEAGFKDDKSGGWNWEASPLTQPIQVDRLCLIMAVATLYTVTEGSLLVDSGRREEIDPHDSRGLSYFKLGLRSIRQLLAHGRRLRLRLQLDPGPDPEPVAPYGIPFLIGQWLKWIPSPTSIPAGC